MIAYRNAMDVRRDVCDHVVIVLIRMLRGRKDERGIPVACKDAARVVGAYRMTQGRLSGAEMRYRTMVILCENPSTDAHVGARVEHIGHRHAHAGQIRTVDLA